MHLFDAARIRQTLKPDALVEALRTAFEDPDTVTVPERVHARVDEELDATLLLMPAWQPAAQDGSWLGVKIVGHYPQNSERGLPAIHGTYLLSEAGTGRPVALLDGTELTRWRTAGASALAASYLAPDEVGEHLIIGAGNVAASLPACYAAVRPVHRTRIWARRAEQARELVDRLREDGIDAAVCEDLRDGVRGADVVSAATSSTEPLILAKDVSPGTHVDLIGAFTPQMAEADEALVTSASVFIDVEEALHEGGDLVGPMSRGAFAVDDVRARLADLVAGRHDGRRSEDEVTLFKSVGTALEDLAAAALVVEQGH